MKILIIIISFLFIESCSVARYVAADPYGERLYLWENSSHIDFVIGMEVKIEEYMEKIG